MFGWGAGINRAIRSADHLYATGPRGDGGAGLGHIQRPRRTSRRAEPAWCSVRTGAKQVVLVG